MTRGPSAAGARAARVGFLGAGEFISFQHLPNVGMSAVGKVHAICDLDERRLAAHAEKYRPAYTSRDHRRLLGDPEVDVVIIGTKQDLHAKFIVEALDAGKWVMCEKPMAETPEETERVLEAERRAKGKLAVGFNRRFAPAYARAKRLLATQKPPFYVNYRLMFPSPQKDTGFYAEKARILYEGTHVFDLVCWLLGAAPERVYMTGDLTRNNVCVLEFPEGSRVSFTCGSMGSYFLWKESMEVFTQYASIVVSEFIDMRVRGFPGEFDAFYAPHVDRLGDEVRRHGLDFYEVRKSQEMEAEVRALGMPCERVVRPGRDFGPLPYEVGARSLLAPDKGWRQSVEHFLSCFLDKSTPGNADGRAGALATDVALCALASLEQGRPLRFASGAP
jgi:predicted dehydrogenase